MTAERPHILRDVVIGVLVVVVGAAVMAFANIPTRVSLVEQSQGNLNEVVKKMDAKLDILVMRRHQ